jgi:hypothetical protein
VTAAETCSEIVTLCSVPLTTYHCRFVSTVAGAVIEYVPSVPTVAEPTSLNARSPAAFCHNSTVDPAGVPPSTAPDTVTCCFPFAGFGDAEIDTLHGATVPQQGGGTLSVAGFSGQHGIVAASGDSIGGPQQVGIGPDVRRGQGTITCVLRCGIASAAEPPRTIADTTAIDGTRASKRRITNLPSGRTSSWYPQLYAENRASQTERVANHGD